MKSLYGHINWIQKRKEIIALDNYTCSDCGRNSNDVVLQVHHLKYINGKFPWEYPIEDLITLCKGCHAREHGLIIPITDWVLVGYNDLGKRIGACELCETLIRHQYIIYHHNWDTLIVGTFCCDNLTQTLDASNHRKFLSKRNRFLQSKRWQVQKNRYIIHQKGFSVLIWKYLSDWYIKIDSLQSNKKYSSLISAKSKAFEVIENKQLHQYLERMNR